MYILQQISQAKSSLYSRLKVEQIFNKFFQGRTVEFGHFNQYAAGVIFDTPTDLNNASLTLTGVSISTKNPFRYDLRFSSIQQRPSKNWKKIELKINPRKPKGGGLAQPP